MPQVHDVFTVKREQDTEDSETLRPDRKRKRIKRETASGDDKSAELRRKPATRGVEQIAYPAECRPIAPSYEHHRVRLITELKGNYALRGRAVIDVRFLDDAVAIDWISDKSATCSVPYEISDRLPKYLNPENTMAAPVKQKHSMMPVDGEIPGLHAYNSGITVDVSQGSICNPILVEDSDPSTRLNSEDTPSSPSSRDITQILPVDDDVASVKRDVSISHTRILSGKLETSSSVSTNDSQDIHIGIITGEPDRKEGQAISPSRLFGPSSSSELDGRGPLSNDVEPRELHLPVDGVRRKRRVSSSSVSSVSSPTSSSESSSSGDARSQRSPGEFAMGLTEPENAYDKYESLKFLNEEDYRSSILIKDLSRTSSVDDIYAFLELHNLSSLVRNVYMVDSGVYGPNASIILKGCKESSMALRVLRNSSLQFPSRSGAKLARPEFLPCILREGQMPVNPIRQTGCQSIRSFSPQRSGSGKAPLRSVVLGSSAATASSFSQIPAPKRRPSSATGNITEPTNASERLMDRLSISKTSEKDDQSLLNRGSPPSGDRSTSLDVIKKSNRPNAIEIMSDPELDDDPADPSAKCVSGLGHHSNSSDADEASSQSSSDFSTDSDSPNTENMAGRIRKAGSSRPNAMSTVVSTHRSTEIQLPTVKYGRARRLLLPLPDTSPLMSVTMRGDIQFIDRTKRERLVNLSLPATSEVHRCEDACLSDGTAVLAFSKGERGQASVVAFTDKAKTRARVFPLGRTPHDQSGIFSVAPFVPSRGLYSATNSDAEGSLEFLSGGYDKKIQLWRVTRSLGIDSQLRFSSRVTSLCKNPLNTKISALVHPPGTSRVLAAAGDRLWTLDVDQQASVYSSRFSNFVNQLHVQRKENPNVFIAELDHLFSQMQVFDVRTERLGSGRPELEFGYPESVPDVRDSRSRKRRGDTTNLHFARGYHDGTVCIWDYRKAREPMIAAKLTTPVTHTIFAGQKNRNLWVFAGGKVNFLEINNPRQNVIFRDREETKIWWAK